MRILMVTGYPPSGRYGGAERFCRELSMKLIGEGEEVSILTSTCEEWRDASLEIDDSLKRVDNLYARKVIFDFTNPQNRRILKERISELGPDVVHFHSVYGVGTDLLQTSSSLVPTMATVHDHWPYCHRSTGIRYGEECEMNCSVCRPPLSSLSRRLKRKQLEKVTLVSPSEYLATRLRQAGFEKVVRIFNAVEMPPEVHGGWSPRAIFAGRLVNEKGVEQLCQAARSMPFRLDVYGEGPLLPYLKDIYPDPDQIEFHGHISNMDEVYREGGMIILPSSIPENLPMVLLEAMSYGLPPIATSLGGVPEIIDNGVDGVLIETNDPFLIEEGVRHLMDEGVHSRMSRNGRTKIATRFNWNQTLRSYLDLYDSLRA
jgi:glycosyltransferase involved in cell wall biosynthesis